MVQDTASKSYLPWRNLRGLISGELLYGLAVLGYRLGLGKLPATKQLYLGQLGVIAWVLLSSRDTLVRKTLRWHRIDKRGRPVANPKPMARLGNREAAALAAAALVAWTGAAFVAGNFNRPTGIRAAPCREADPAVLDRITARKTNAKAVYATTRMVRYKDVDVVVALIDLDGNLEKPSPPPSPAPSPSGSAAPKDDKTIEAWIVTDLRVERLGNDPKATTDHPAIEKPDSALNPAIERVAICLGEKPIR